MAKIVISRMRISFFLGPHARFLFRYAKEQEPALVPHDIQKKKRIMEMNIGSNGFVTLAIGRAYVATYETRRDQLCIVELESGKVIESAFSDLDSQRRA